MKEYKYLGCVFSKISISKYLKGIKKEPRTLWGRYGAWKNRRKINITIRMYMWQEHEEEIELVQEMEKVWKCFPT